MKLRGICDGRPPFCTSLRDIKVPGRNVAMMDGVLSLSQLDPWQAATPSLYTEKCFDK